MGEIIPFGRAFTRATSGPWSGAEVAELNSLARSILGHGGHGLEVATGLGEAGDPWFVVANTDTGETLLHVARIGGRFVLHHVARGLLAEDPDLRALLRRANPSAAPTATIVPMGPGELALLLFVVSALLGHADAFAAADDEVGVAIPDATVAEAEAAAGLMGCEAVLDAPGTSSVPAHLSNTAPNVAGAAPPPPPPTGPVLPVTATPPGAARPGAGQAGEAPVALALDVPVTPADPVEVQASEPVPLGVSAPNREASPATTATVEPTSEAKSAAAPDQVSHALALATAVKPEPPALVAPTPEGGVPILLGVEAVTRATDAAETFIVAAMPPASPPAILLGFDPHAGDLLIFPPAQDVDAPGPVEPAAPPAPETPSEPVEAGSAEQYWSVGRYRDAEGSRWLWIDLDRDGDVELLVELPDAARDRRAIIAALAPEVLIVGADARKMARHLDGGRAGSDGGRQRDRGDGLPEVFEGAPVDGAHPAGHRWQRFYADAVQAANEALPVPEQPTGPLPPPEEPVLSDPSVPTPLAWIL